MRGGHEVHLLCQDRDPLALDWVDAAGDWDGGSLAVRRCGASRCGRPSTGPTSAGCCRSTSPTATRAIEARPFPDLSEAEVDRYVAANVAAVREVAARVKPDVALANHLVMGPVVLARGLARGGRAVRGQDPRQRARVHGQAAPALQARTRAEGLDGARGILVGSRHTAESLWTEMADPTVEPATRLGPPGVDIAPLHAARRRRRRTRASSACARGWRRPTSADGARRAAAAAGRARRLVRPLGRRGGRGARHRRARRPARGLRRQADRVEGRRAAARGLAARAGPRAAGAAAGRRVRRLPARARGRSRATSSAATSTPRGRCAASTAPSCRTWRRSWTRSRIRTPTARPPAG